MFIANIVYNNLISHDLVDSLGFNSADNYRIFAQSIVSSFLIQELTWKTFICNSSVFLFCKWMRPIFQIVNLALLFFRIFFPVTSTIEA